MTYETALASLDSLVNFERRHDAQAMRDVKLSRMRRLCRRIGDPQRRFRSVLVTGTNGKGSIAAMLYSMLRASRLRVGLYTSPHVERLRERIRVWTSGRDDAPRAHGDDWISEAAFAGVIERLWPAVEALRTDPLLGPPTYFEVLTAAAFAHFREQDVEVAVLEVGMGGRLDATNVVEQAVSIISPVDLDHTDVLGDDAVAIAAEKAGIIKPGQIVISSPQSEGVREMLRAACAGQAVPMLTCGREITARTLSHSPDGLRVAVTGLRGIYDDVAIPMLGRHQADNAAVAIAALEALSSSGVPARLVEQGMARVDWPGRQEIVSTEPLVIMDGGHNPHAANALGRTLVELCEGRRIHLLLGLSADKAPEAIAQRLGPLAVSATCTTSRHPRAMDPTELAMRCAPFCADVHVMSDPVDAYTYLLNAVAPQDVIVVTGSLFLVGQLRAALRQAHVRPRRRRAVEPAAA